MRPSSVEFMDSGGWCFEFSDVNGIYVLLICCGRLSEFERWQYGCCCCCGVGQILESWLDAGQGSDRPDS